MGVAWMVLGSTSRKLTVDGGPPQFSVFEQRADDLPFLGEVSIPLAWGARERRRILAVLPRHWGVHCRVFPRWVALHSDHREGPLLKLSRGRGDQAEEALCANALCKRHVRTLC